MDAPHLVDEFGHNIERRYLKESQKTSDDQAIDPPFLLLSDSSREAIQKLGIGEEHPRFGLVARPTTLLLDKEGKIRWLYLGKSAEDRPTPDAILKGLKWWF